MFIRNTYQNRHAPNINRQLIKQRRPSYRDASKRLRGANSEEYAVQRGCCIRLQLAGWRQRCRGLEVVAQRLESSAMGCGSVGSPPCVELVCGHTFVFLLGTDERVFALPVTRC